jgi:hypothetical protein
MDPHVGKKSPVVRRQDYTICFEYRSDTGIPRHDHGTYVHCDVYRWNRSIAGALQKDWKALADLQGHAMLYCVHEPWDRKHFKFIKMFGFEKLTDVKCFDGITREIYFYKRP